MTRLPIRLGFLCLCLLAAFAANGQKIAEKNLSPKYREWMNLVAYHIQPVEKDVFLQLTNDRDRDIFVETFWKQRDPTPGTPENEYRDELVKRFKYCNEFYGRGTTREGWRTDMGRIHMVLGPPASVEHFEATIGLVPCYSWSYYGECGAEPASPLRSLVLPTRRYRRVQAIRSGFRRPNPSYS